MATQNVSGALQVDQALKLCKMSYEIDSRIRSGEDFDKILASYDKLVRIADFTPKNAKNANDFDSVGELYRWLEKRGWKNKYYDGATRDVVDETIKNIQAWNQRLYLKVNKEKTVVSYVRGVKYLGYSFYVMKVKCQLTVHPKSKAKMKTVCQWDLR